MDISSGIVVKQDKSVTNFWQRRLVLPATLCLLMAAAAAGFGCKKAAPQPLAPPPQPAVVTPAPAPPTPAPTQRPFTPTPTSLPTTTPQPTPVTVDVPITVKGALKLGSLQFELKYDQQAIQLQNVKAGPLARNALVDSNKSAPGVVKIGLVSTSGISGDGAVITLTFVPLGKGGPNNLNVSNIDAADTDLRDLVVSGTPGQFSGGSGQVTGPVLSFRK